MLRQPIQINVFPPILEQIRFSNLHFDVKEVKAIVLSEAEEGEAASVRVRRDQKGMCSGAKRDGTPGVKIKAPDRTAQPGNIKCTKTDEEE